MHKTYTILDSVNDTIWEMTNKKTFLASFALALLLLIGGGVYAWTAPTQAPPNGNVAAPINVSAVAQVKSGGLSVNRFVVNEHMILAGPAAGTVRYLNFNTTLGGTGYGFRDNNGVMQFKDAANTTWRPIQSGNRQMKQLSASGVWTSNPSNGLYYSSAQVYCDAGYSAVGGGGYCDAAAGGPVSLFSNRPAGGTGWEAGCHQQPPVTWPGGNGAVAYVICLQD
jgi:hypothetical protein